MKNGGAQVGSEWGVGATKKLASGEAWTEGGAVCLLLMGPLRPRRHPSLQGSTLTITYFYKQCDWLILGTFSGRTLLVTVTQPMLLAKGMK